MPDVSYSAEMPANGRRTSKEPNQHPEPDDRDRLLPREELGMNQPAVNERVGAVGERDRRQPAEHPYGAYALINRWLIHAEFFSREQAVAIVGFGMLIGFF